MNDEQELLSNLRAEVADGLAVTGTRALSLEDRRELARQLALDRLRSFSSERMTRGQGPIDSEEEQRLAHVVLDALFGLGRLQALVDDPSIENIDVNGADCVWVTYADGAKTRVAPVAHSDQELIEIIRSAAARFGLSERRFDTSHPELDLRLPDGSRLSALMSVVARPVISVRRHRYLDISLDDLVRLGFVDDLVSSFLSAAVRARKNIVVGGAMNSGKTTLIRALAAEIPTRERVVTIEQAFELGLDAMPHRHPDMIALETRLANTEGQGEVSMARLVRRALRMNADRVIVGEVLGDEVLPMLNAMSQGRSGSMCTIHADSSSGIFRRLASYAIQSPERLPVESSNILIAGAVHFVVFIDVKGSPTSTPALRGRREFGYVTGAPIEAEGYLPRFESVQRHRFVSSIREVVGAEGLQVISNEVFTSRDGRQAVPVAPLRTATLDELVEHGFEPSMGAVKEMRSWR